MKVLGLTGGVGMGKSACAQLAAARGIPVVDTDDLARQVVEPGEAALSEIEGVFGSEVIDSSGRLDRGELARHVFANPAARKKLEEILHPRIRQLWHQKVKAWSEQGLRVGIVVIPLLFETEAEKELDATICVACSWPSQWSRLLDRGWSREQIDGRIGAQLPAATKMERADFVIWSEGTLEMHGAQLDKILGQIRNPKLEIRNKW